MDNFSNKQAVSKIQAYIEKNIKKRMSLYEIANIAGYSPGHMSKIFKQYTGKTIFDYMRALRMSKAALTLRDEKIAVIDVALDFMFDSHEGFTRAFAKEFGITPKKYAVNAPPLKLFMPYPIIEEKKQGSDLMEDGVKTEMVFIQVVERVKRKAIIKRGIKATNYFEYCDDVGCDVWGVLCSIKDAINEPMGMWLPRRSIDEGTSTYVQGVEVKDDFNGQVPGGYELISLKSCKMMIFQEQKYDDSDFENEVLKVMEAVENYDPSLFGFEWAYRDGPRFQFEPQGSRGYIEGKPVRQII